jgi:hypothetical protein
MMGVSVSGMWPRLETVNDEINIQQLLVGQIIAVDACIGLCKLDPSQQHILGQ